MKKRYAAFVPSASHVLGRTTTLIEQLIFGLGLHHSIITGSVRGASDDAARYHRIYSLSNSFDISARRTEREMYTGHGAVKDFFARAEQGSCSKSKCVALSAFEYSFLHELKQ